MATTSPTSQNHGGTEMTPTKILDRSQAPEGRTAHPFSFPHFVHREISEGFHLWMARRPRVPLVELEILSGGGASHQGPQESGLASLTADLLDEGSQRRSGVDLAMDVEQRGGALGTGAGWHATYANVQFLADQWTAAIPILEEIFLEPTFPESEVKRLIGQRQAEILRRRDHPGSIAEEALLRLLWPHSPWASSLIGEPGHLETYGRDEVAHFWKEKAFTGPFHMIVAGDFCPDTLEEKARELFHLFPTDQAKTLEDIPAHQPDHREIHIIDRPGSTQTELRLVHDGPNRSHPNRAPFRMANAILGGKFTSRLNLNLREERGYTYGVSSRFESRRWGGRFKVGAAVETEHAEDSLRQIVLEMKRIQSQGISPQEIEETRSYLLGVFPYTVQSCGDIQQRIADIALHQLAEDEHDRAQAAIAAVTGREVEEAASTYFSPEKCLVVAVGPASELETSLRSFGETRVWAPGEIFAD